MSKKWFKNIIHGKLFCAIEHTNVQQKPQINFLLLKKQKREFVVEKKGICLEFNELFKFLKKKQHLFLIVNNEQVLTKSINGKLESQKAVHTAFPNLNSSEFYYESYSNESNTFVSICRRSYVDEMIEKYERASLNIIGFSLGNLIGTQLLSFIDDVELHTSNAILSIKNKVLIDIRKTEEGFQKIYTINDLEVNNNSVLGLGGILSYYTGQTITQKSFVDKASELQNKFTQIRTFDLGLKVGLGFIFILLLFNFLIFSNFRDKINIINSEIEINESYKVNLLSLKEEVVKKKKIVDEITSSETSKVSLFLDKIGASIPNTILLTHLNYQPLTKNIKKEKEIQYQQQQILIKGKSTNGTVFSKWAASLEQEKWIKSITLMNYGTGKKTITEFQLKITLSK